MQDLSAVQPIDRKVLKKARHKWELPLFTLCVALTVCAILLVGSLFIPMIAAEVENVEQERNSYLLLILAIPAITIGIMHYFYAKIRARSVRVTEKNFPEIYHKVEEFSKMLGLKKTPPVYIVQENGGLNASAWGIIGKRWSSISAEIVDIAYMENKDFKPAYFILAHELGHIYLGHSSVTHALLVALGIKIPIFGPLFSRSREYSCDRIAQLLTNSDGFEEMMILSAGRHLYKYVDREDYLADKKDSGIASFILNIQASHPLLPKRVAALTDPEKKDGKLIW